MSTYRTPELQSGARTPKQPDYHGTIVRYLASCKESRDIPGRQLANASSMLERLKLDHPALRGSLIAMLGAKHADAVLTLSASLAKECDGYLKRVSAQGRIHHVLIQFLTEAPHQFALRSEWDWQVVSQLLTDYPCADGAAEKALRERLAEKLPAAIARELGDRARKAALSNRELT